MADLTYLRLGKFSKQVIILSVEMILILKKY